MRWLSTSSLAALAGIPKRAASEEVCRHHSIPVWCGGMLESGIGRVHNIAMSTLEGFTLPGDVSASKRYWDEDIIEPEVEVTSKGAIHVPKAPGMGYLVRRDRIEGSLRFGHSSCSPLEQALSTPMRTIRTGAWFLRGFAPLVSAPAARHVVPVQI